MNPKTYKAIFSDSDEKTRTTARTYTHAWRVSANGFTDYGFAGSQKLASTAAYSLATRKYGSKVEVVSCEVQSCEPALHDDFDFETNMTETEARDKHAQLKSLHSVARVLLLEIRDRKGYLALGFSSFEEYGEKEWGYTRTYIHRLAKAEEIQQGLSVPIGTELKESQLRELGKIPAEDRDAIYQEAKAKAEAENQAFTARMLAEAVADYQKKNKALQTELDILKPVYEKLNTAFNSEVNTLVEKRIIAKQPQLEQQIEQKLREEYAAVAEDQKIQIIRLKNDLETAKKANKKDDIAKIEEKIRAQQQQLEQGKQHIESLNQQIAEKQVSIQTDEQINQGYRNTLESIIQGIAASLSTMDVYIEFDGSQLNTLFYPRCELFPSTSTALDKTIAELDDTLKTLRFMRTATPK